MSQSIICVPTQYLNMTRMSRWRNPPTASAKVAPEGEPDQAGRDGRQHAQARNQAAEYDRDLAVPLQRVVDLLEPLGRRADVRPDRLMIACPPEAESAYRMLPPITVASSSRTSTPISPTFPCAACTPIRTISRSPG